MNKCSSLRGLTCSCSLFLVLLLLQQSEAGVLTLFGEKAERLGKTVHDGTVKVEEELQGYVYGKPSVEGEPLVVPPADELQVPEEPRVIPEEPPAAGAKPKNQNNNHRHQIIGAPRCNPGMIFEAGECREDI